MRWLLDRLRPWRFRQEVQTKATHLIAAYGDHAYTVAREEARRGNRGARGGRDRFWTAVALAIADSEGREIGVTGADRFPNA